MTIPLKTHILVADDHPLVLRGLRAVLDAQPDLRVLTSHAHVRALAGIGLPLEAHGECELGC
jgi:DNA-binding NarL/FixJ family response regulator